MDDDQSVAPGRDRSTRAGVAGGLACGGVVALVVAWVLGDDFSPAEILVAEPNSGWVRVATVVVVFLLAGVGWLRWRHAGDPAVRWGTTVAAVVAVVLAGLAGWGFGGQFYRGFPGQATLLAVLGGLAVAAGTLAGLRVAGRWRVLPAAGAFLLVPVVATPLVLVSPDLRVDATTASPADAPAVPGSVSTVAWSYQVDGRVQDVVAAGTGVVVLLDDGVVALDGRTGDVRWSRARHGAEAVAVGASPDGATVMVQYRAGNRFQLRREVVDAYTGQVRFTVDNGNNASSDGWFTPMTNTVFVDADRDDREFSGYSLADHRELWTYRVPDDCWVESHPHTVFTVPNGWLLPMVCPMEKANLQYLMIDATTGKVRWSHELPFSQGADVTVDPTFSPDREVLAVRATAGSGTWLETKEAVVDTETGKALPAPVPDKLGPSSMAFVSDNEGQLVDVTSGETVPSTAAARTCLRSDLSVFLASGAVCVDPAVESFDGIVDSGRINIAVGGFTDEKLDLVPVTLGGPFVKPDYGYDGDPVQLVAAPGAVVVFSEAPLDDGGRVQVVGLR